MNVSIVDPQSLSSDQLARWRRLREANAALVSPFFAPEFTLAVAAQRANVQVAVIEDSSQTIGFFPFERVGARTGRPVGGPLSDYHGVITAASTRLDVAKLISACGISRWGFDHLVDHSDAFQHFVEVKESSPYVDLSQGYDAYIRERREAKSDVIGQTLRKERKFARDAGPLRFLFHQQDLGTLETLIRWKREQYRRTGTVDVFEFPWTGELLRRLLTDPSADLQAVLSALYAGENLAAVHFGLRSHGVLHSWFPAYDVALGRYSPGAVLTLKILERCVEHGVERYDFGKGPEAYKRSFTPLAAPLVEGRVDTSSLRRSVRRAWRKSKDWVKRTPLQSAARVAGRMLYQLSHKKAFRE